MFNEREILVITDSVVLALQRPINQPETHDDDDDEGEDHGNIDHCTPPASWMFQHDLWYPRGRWLPRFGDQQGASLSALSSGRVLQ
jgi:hypothetical protein